MLSAINELNSVCLSDADDRDITEETSHLSSSQELSPRNRSDTGLTTISVEEATDKLQKDEKYLPAKTEMLDIDDAKKTFRKYLYNLGILDDLMVGDKLAVVEQMYDITKIVTEFKINRAGIFQGIERWFTNQDREKTQICLSYKVFNFTIFIRTLMSFYIFNAKQNHHIHKILFLLRECYKLILVIISGLSKLIRTYQRDNEIVLKFYNTLELCQTTMKEMTRIKYIM